MIFVFEFYLFEYAFFSRFIIQFYSSMDRQFIYRYQVNQFSSDDRRFEIVSINQLLYCFYDLVQRIFLIRFDATEYKLNTSAWKQDIDCQ